MKIIQSKNLKPKISHHTKQKEPYNQSNNFCLTTRQKIKNQNHQSHFFWENQPKRKWRVFTPTSNLKKDPFPIFLRKQADHQISTGVLLLQNSNPWESFFTFSWEMMQESLFFILQRRVKARRFKTYHQSSSW